MSTKQHLNFHGTVSTFVCRLHPSMTGAPALGLPTPSTPRTVLSTMREREESMLTRRESITMFACVEEYRVRQMAFRLNSFTGLLSCVHRTGSPGILAFLLKGCLELV